MTAFGEPMQSSGPGVPPVGTRYGYAGSWGYEEAECRVLDLNGEEPGGETTWCDPLAELGWLHVGHRYYDPASGRFVQRDPIGIRGGLNTYAYVLNNPLSGADPSGLILGWLWGDEETGDWLLDLTGGRHSWLDHKETVQKVSDVAAGVGIACSGAALAGMVPVITASALPFVPTLGQRFNENQQALIELARSAQRTGVTKEQAQTLIQWANEYGVRAWDHATTWTHWIAPHIRIGPINHIVVY